MVAAGPVCLAAPHLIWSVVVNTWNLTARRAVDLCRQASAMCATRRCCPAR
ncbi:putative leader peptide [Georgenia sp. SYP-B2076]|uniref:putative leader peptide n=1 Tax=Georgenia sp. SYP-B2076 TaxID=2495881 RepID=UPI0035124C85